MASRVRCTNPAKRCSLSRTGEALQPADWENHVTEHPDCAAWAEEVSWATTWKKPLLLGAVGLLALVVIAIVAAAASGNPAKERLDGIRAKLEGLEARLVDLESRPAPTQPRVEGLKKLIVRADLTLADLEPAIEGRQAAAVERNRQMLGILRGEFERLRSAPPSSGGPAASGMEARALGAEFDEVAAAAKAESSVDAGDLSTRAEVGAARARRLVRSEMSQTSGDELVSEIERLLGEAEGLAANFEPLPFSMEEADLRLGASPGLARSFVIPLLEAFAGAEAVASRGTWFLLAKDGVKWLITSDSDPFASMGKGECDLVFTDRAPSQDERDAFAASFPGEDLESRAYGEVLALDALTLPVHPDSDLEALGPEKQATGKRLLAGTAASRASERFGFSPDEMVDLPAADAVLRRKEVVGLGLYHEEGVNLRARRLAWRPAADGVAFQPSPFTIATEDYGLTFRIAAWNPPEAKPAADRFVKFITSDAGQEVVGRLGYVDLRLKVKQESPDPLILAALAEALDLDSISGARRVSTNLRFASGEDTFDLKTLADLERLPKTLAAEGGGGQLVILGFTDDTGGPAINGPLSGRRAATVAVALAKVGITAATGGLGALFPLDDNGTEQGKARNRRCEVWIVEP